jgi:ABC-type multidrug transport system ATPase subunit
MRLISLYIDDYKNIKKQTFDFSANTGYIALIGLNGSGKSNLLEAISLIFQGLFDKKEIPFDYEIKYEMDGHLYERKKRSAKKDSFRVKDVEMQYPSSVVACYSGEDLRLWHMAYEDYYMHYFKSAIDGKLLTPKLIYINRYCWEIALIALMCSDNLDIKSFLKSNFDITDLDDIEISFKFAENDDNFKKHNALKWIKRIKEKCLDSEGKATLKSFFSYDFPLIPNQTKESTIFHYLYLLSQPKKNPEKGNNVDKYITKIRIANKGIPSFSFSEGHKKLILIECITKVLGNKESIILFDEPDAHVHIALKKEILTCINDFGGQTLLTTHSPMFVNQMSDNNIYPIIDGKVLPHEKRALIQKITNNEINYIDGACIVSSKYMLVTEGPDDIYHIKSAISAFSTKDNKFKELDKISFVYMGGAKGVDNYYDEILKSLYDTMTKIVFAFDYDEEGREGAKMVQRLIDSGKTKLQYVFYHKTYPVPEPNVDFYLEDFFERTAYIDVQLPIINGVPSFAELKKASTWANSIKKRIQKHKSDKSLSPKDYNGFQAFLEQLILSFAL